MRVPPMSPRPLLLLALCLSVGCGLGSSGMQPPPGPEQDSGTSTEGSPDAGSQPDAGPGTDAGSHLDAGMGSDAGTPPSSDAGSGTSPDAGPGADAGQDAGSTTDAGSGADAGSTTDAGTGADAGVGSCGLPYLGDPSAPLTFTPTAVGPDYTSASIAVGSTVSVIEPFQGGRVSFIGVRNVLNMDPCGATIIGAIRDPISHQLQLDSRTFNLLRGSDGKGSSDDADTSTFSNVTLCPNNWSSQDLYDKDYDLIVILKDSKGKSLQQTFTVRMACNVPGQEAYCKCICNQGYKLGDPCP